MNPDWVVRSVTIAEVVADDGDTYLSLATTGDPALWHIIGMLAYGVAATTAQATWPDEET